MQLTNDLFYIGVNDHKVDLFEGQYDVPNGMSYNSYVFMDEKIAVIDTVDRCFTEDWMKQLSTVLRDKTPDYLIIHHMEPDHSANIVNFLQQYPQTTLVGNAKTFKMLEQFFEMENDYQKCIVNDNDELCLGKHTLKFIFAPMVHWPEVMMSIDLTDKVLFSADAFGKFGANDVKDEWLNEARRYYFGIVGKYGPQVQMTLKKLAGVEVNMICGLHGPILKENVQQYLTYYDTWSKYEPEQEGIVIAYASIYGHTKKCVEYLKKVLSESTQLPIILHDLAREDMSKCVSDAFCYDRLVLASSTYNADVFPCMKEFIHHLTERNFQKRQIALIENGSWAPMAIKAMKSMLEKSKEITFMTPEISIQSAMKEDTKELVKQLAQALVQ